MLNNWSGGQYSLFRVLFGAYLVTHFVHLLPWAAELFSREGVIQTATSSPLFNIIPNILAISDHPMMALGMILSAGLASIAFTLGFKDKLAAGWILYVLICLFARNPLIANPALPYVGFMLLSHLFIPSGPFGSLQAHGDRALGKHWSMPRSVYLSAAIVLALSYTYSGYTKLFSPSWVSGDTIAYVLENPLARDHRLNEFLLDLPAILLNLVTWSILYVELLYAPLALIRGMSKWLWSGMLFVQVGFLLLLNFPDLTVAMILMHLFTFNPDWVKTGQRVRSETLYYDGVCGFCHAFIRFVLAEDSAGRFQFSPLESGHFIENVPPEIRFNLPVSLVVITVDGQARTKSNAVIYILMSLGGLWKIAAHLLQLFPPAIRDWGYDNIGKVRRKLFPTPDNACPMLSPHLQQRFV